MATELVNLLARREAIAEELAAMSATSAGGKPNASGKNVDHVGYRMSLYQERREINEQIAVVTGGTTVEVIGRV